MKKEEKKAEKSFTPMMEQYLEVKKKHPDLIILFRLGDFYEMFFDDAVLASKELQLYLTSKSAGVKDKVPMCGIPHHAYLSYVQKLLDNGHKVGIVEQLEDPKKAKGIVKRDVVQIITPGANLDVEGNDHNYIATVVDCSYSYIVAYADLSTGDLEVVNVNHTYEDVLSALVNYEVKEVVLSTSIDAKLVEIIHSNTKICISYSNSDQVDISFEPLFKYLKDERQIIAVSKLMNYLLLTQKRSLDYFKPAVNRVSNKYLKLDHSTKTNLELVKSLNGDGTYGSLYWLLNATSTPMGARLLKNYILEPLSDQAEIEKRLDKVEELIDSYLTREDLKKSLEKIYDLDRLIARVGFDSCSGKEMLQLASSLRIVPEIKREVSSLSSANFASISAGLGDFSSLLATLDKAVDPSCPPSVKEGGIFKLGYDPELDEIINMAKDGKAYLLQIEQREKERTGIKTLKIGYSKIFGYYIEISNGALSQVKPEFNYIRKQTMTTGERFITEELKRVEEDILNAQQKRIELEYQKFQELRQYVKSFTMEIQNLADALAELDCLVSLAEVSSKNRYVRPKFNSIRNISVIDARHPVIEKVDPSKRFVENSYFLNNDVDVLVITGPNMGGKSTYMRELALIVIMAQLGCFVPAKEADLFVFDQIFTRIGASDDLIKGESTFMVEMSETNRALTYATSSSLLLFDEIGRGTATYDGMALAQAIIEYVVRKIHAKTLFSTHYHEITSLVSDLPGVKNVHVSVLEENGDITFLYKVEEGPMDKSYGINVARLAHLPEEVISRASEILTDLENSNRDYDKIKLKDEVNVKAKSVDQIREKLKSIDPLTVSPLEALNLLFELKKEAEKK